MIINYPRLIYASQPTRDSCYRSFGNFDVAVSNFSGKHLNNMLMLNKKSHYI